MAVVAAVGDEISIAAALDSEIGLPASVAAAVVVVAVAPGGLL